MRIGCCGPASKIARITGIDFLEIPCCDLDAVNYAEKAYRLLPSSMNIFSDVEPALREVSEILRIAETRQVKILTFGSGKSRATQNNSISTYETSVLSEFLQEIDGQSQGLKIAIEPLSPKETNLINRVEQAAEWITTLGLKNFGITIDAYHFDFERTSISDLDTFRDLIVHAHISDSNQNVPEFLTNYLVEFSSFVSGCGCDISIESVPYREPPEKLIKALRRSIC